MACRLLAILGSCRASDSSEAAITEHMKGVRLHLLGACIITEGIWCLYMSRSSSIPRSILQAAALSCRRQQAPDSTTLAVWLGLSGPMADICDVLNGGRPLHADAKSRLARLNTDLDHWLETL